MTQHNPKLSKQKVVYPIPDIEDFIDAAMTLPDQAQAIKVVEEQAGLVFDMATHDEITQLETDISDTQDAYELSQKTLGEQHRQLSLTTPTVKAAAILKTQSDQITHSPLVKTKDMAVALLSLLLGCVVVIMGGSNVYSIIIASGTPVFLESPHLAIMLSGLLPIGSIALKFFAHYLPHDKAKKRYTITVYLLSALSLLAWVILFGITFKSAGSGIDWDSFDTQNMSGTKDELFTVVQLLAELLVGATLFMVAGDIFSMYSPTTLLPNPVYEEHRQNLNSLQVDHTKLADSYKNKQGRIGSLKAARKAYINTQLALYMRKAACLHGASLPKPNSQKENKMMKGLLVKTLFGIILLTGSSPEVYAKQMIMGISPVLEQKTSKEQTKSILQFLTRKVQPGEEVLIFDAWNIQSLGTFAVPDKALYNSEKAKLQANRALVSRLMSMGKDDHLLVKQTVKGAIKMPQFLEFVSLNYGPIEDMDILIFGSPIYTDLKTPQMSMTGGKIAGDGHFKSLPSDTPFSIIGKERLLENTRIHLFIPDKNWAMSEHYAYWVKRMWTLFIEGQGGALSSFTSDAQTFWRRAEMSAGALPHDFKITDSSKMETLVVAKKSDQTHSIYERKLSNKRVSKDILRMAKQVEIGISWDCKNCDLDLYVKPHQSAQVLYFGSPTSPEGVFHRDFVQSPKTDGGFETITFQVPVDLSNTLIAINWYGGNSQRRRIRSLQGEIRLAIGQETYALPFNIQARQGNQGLGRELTLKTRKAANSHWLIISPKDILKL